jgi:hypothetical protein
LIFIALTCGTYSILLLCVAHSLSFSIIGPDTAPSGEPIEFTWARADGDPLSFGLMQRSLAGDAPILGIMGILNSAGATTGTVSVVFQTAGYVVFMLAVSTALN